jgi:diguanylate cyclase (GGDEF)-like protein
LPHQLNEPSHRVTISIGGATSRWSNFAQCTALVETADRALYQAKESGRDRMVMSAQILELRSIA